jgi:transcriptional regulator with XRE-family HTH domain
MGFQDNIAKIFKNAREKARLTQAEVAEKAGIHVNYYARIERAEVVARGDILNKVAKALKMKINLPLES